ncbi:hypothetical protein ABK040_007887 [Willaertia magna]
MSFAILAEMENVDVEELQPKKKKGRPRKKPLWFELFPVKAYMQRNWKYNSESQLDGNHKKSFTFLSYNMLCQAYARKTFFPYIGNAIQVIHWSTRKERLLEEFKCYNSDIICLQECDRYFEYWKNKFEELHYDSFHTNRTGSKPDGCAIFWRNTNYELIDCFSLNLIDIVYEFDKDHSEFTNKKNRFETHNVASVVLLKDCTSSTTKEEKVLCVVNLHLFWDPNFPDVKLNQMIYILIKTKEYLNNIKNYSLIICGDFNSLPNSEVYELMTKGETYLTKDFVIYHKDSSLSSYVTIENDGKSQKFINPFGNELKSCYNEVFKNEPSFTNYTRDFNGCLDYIFYLNSNSFIKVHGALEMITEERAKEFVALPSNRFPSDHLAMCCKFQVLE